MPEIHQEHPLYSALYDYADHLFELLDHECYADQAWPKALDLDELERHLLDSVSQLGIVLDLKDDAAKRLELMGLSFNNFRIVLNLLRNILLDEVFSRERADFRAALHNFLNKGVGLERVLLKNLNELSTKLS